MCRILQASNSVFAAILGDGSVVTRGHADYGGGSRSVQEQLPDLRAILGVGAVVTWVNADYGGDSSAVQDQLRHL